MDATAARAFYAEENWGNRWAIKGPLYDPTTGHKGHDIAAAGRNVVPALRPGRVAAIYRHPVIGWVIAIEHAAGDIDGYCHVTQPLVAVGDRIDQWGDLARVATWGDYTGSAWRGPHIHLVNAATVQRIHMGPTRDPAPIIRAQLHALAGGGTTPIDPEEDDMAHFDLIKTPDGTVWWCVNRATRYAIPNGDALATYRAFARELTGSDLPIRAKSHAQILAYGAPVYASPVVASSDTPAILAAIQALPARTVAEIKNAL